MQVTKNKFLNRRGFGIHSPWAYDLITNVIEEKLPYYAYDDLYDYWKLCPDSLPQYDENIDQLLFRLVNALHPRLIVEIGTGAGVSTGYLASVSSAIPCITLDTRHPFNAQVSKAVSSFGNVEYRIGDVLQMLESITQDGRPIDFVHVAHTALFRESMEILIPCLNDKSVVLVEGINGRNRQKWFETLSAGNETGVVITKGSAGMLFFDKKMYKQHYRL